MELHQIRYFLALCAELNFTRAAERCKVAQSSLTRAIKALEIELGGALFHRARANTHLSRLGLKVRPLLEQAYAHVEGARRQAQDFLRLHAASLRLGLMGTVEPRPFVELIGALRRSQPDIALQVTEASAQALQDALLAGELDAAIYALPGLSADDRFNHLRLYREPFVIVVKNTHRLARHEAIHAADLAGEPALRRSDCEHETAFQAFTRLGMDQQVLLQSGRDDWILTMAAAGLGYGLLPAFSAGHPGVAALRLIEPEIAREVCLVTMRGRPDSSPVGALVHEVTRVRWISGLAQGSLAAADQRSLARIPAR